MASEEWVFRVKNVLTVIFIVFVMILVDSLFAWLSIPVVSMDLLLFGLALVMVVIGFKVRVKLSDLIKTRSAMSLSFTQRLGYSVFMLLLIGMGVYLTIEGFKKSTGIIHWRQRRLAWVHRGRVGRIGHDL